MSKRICQIGIAVCLLVGVGQCMLGMHWERERDESYYYTLAISGAGPDNVATLSDRFALEIPVDYRVSGWPANGSHWWSFVAKPLEERTSIYVHLDRFGSPHIPVWLITQPISNEFCRPQNGLNVCSSNLGSFRYISEWSEHGGVGHSCISFKGGLGESDEALMQVTIFYAPGRWERLELSSDSASAMLHQETIGYLLQQMSYRPSGKYLRACLFEDG